MARFKNWKKNGFEFLSIFVAVISAFALNNCNENRRDAHSENKILTEISNGLDKDLQDIELNLKGHQDGVAACKFFRKVVAGQVVPTDSLLFHYVNLTRDFISIQNIAGYETLKSKGLELINNDSLRLQIISLYEYEYNTLRKFEEEYAEMQFHKNYFYTINQELAPYFTTDTNGILTGIELPIQLSKAKRNEVLLYLIKIQTNRLFVMNYYNTIEQSIHNVRKEIELEIGE